MKDLRHIYIVMIMSILIVPCTAAAEHQDIVKRVADNLVNSQRMNGSWSNEEEFTGSIVAGLVNAYEVTENKDYLGAAELGASYILQASGGNFYGDEAYALARLAEVAGQTSYSETVKDFYDNMNTNDYILAYGQTYVSNAVFYVAQHTVASHMVGAADANVWRDALIYFLSQVDDDTAYCPVMCLGVATWALAQTGLMDDAMVDPFNLAGRECWADVPLCALPDMLASHQVPSGERANCFFVKFNHTSPGEGSEICGYTEDAIYGVLGLEACNGLSMEDDTVLDFCTNINCARDVLSLSVSASGYVSAHIWSSGERVYYTYGGELLQAMCE